jgi:hypothetical protein
MSQGNVLFLIEPGPRPPFARIAELLWGAGADFDSDGNSNRPDDTSWTELTIQRRATFDERIDIDQVSEDPLVLKIASSSESLVRRVATYLADECSASVVAQWPSFSRRS